MAGSAGVSVRNAASLLEQAGIESPQREARLMLAKTLDCSVTYLIAHPETHLSGPTQTAYNSMVSDRAQRRPLAYVLGEWEFYGLCLNVTPDVLVPRPETEVLVEAVLERLVGVSVTPPHPSPAHDGAGKGQTLGRGPLIADIGTGSGAIAVALAADVPSARIVATDISQEALQVAEANAEKYNLAERIEFLQGDLLEPLLGRKPFDAIVSNPPYVRTADLEDPQPELLWEPRGALDGGEDGLDVYRGLLPGAFGLVKDTGFVAVEVGIGQAGDVRGIALRAGYRRTERLADLAGIERVVVAWK